MPFGTIWEADLVGLFTHGTTKSVITRQLEKPLPVSVGSLDKIARLS
jgi:hypothetical protein